MSEIVFYKATFCCVVFAIGFTVLLYQKGQGTINRKHLWRGLLIIIAVSYLLPLLGISWFMWHTVPGHILSFLLCIGLPGTLYLYSQYHSEVLKKHFERLKWAVLLYVLIIGTSGATW